MGPPNCILCLIVYNFGVSGGETFGEEVLLLCLPFYDLPSQFGLRLWILSPLGSGQCLS